MVSARKKGVTCHLALALRQPRVHRRARCRASGFGLEFYRLQLSRNPGGFLACTVHCAVVTHSTCQATTTLATETHVFGEPRITRVIRMIKSGKDMMW